MRSHSPATGPTRELYDAFRRGDIDRRTFVTRATALGLGTAMTLFLANHGASAQTPAASPAAVAGAGTIPSVGTENQQRGEGGELNIIQWQAPTLLSPHVATGVKDNLASVLVLEPLIHYLPDASPAPNLVTEIPSLENGGLNEELTEVTLHLLPDVLWSDGTPFTADDVVFTIDWVKNPENNSVNQNVFAPIATAEAVDELTVHVTFEAPNPFWMEPFAGTSTGFVYPKHILESGPEAHTSFLSAPIGTGPYVVESFTPNDQVTYVANENYREPNKPFFATVNLKGGGDAPAAARAVLQTGEYDFAWNLQVEPEVLEGMATEDAPGQLVPYPGVAVERINFQFADPWTEVDGQRAHVDTQHPFLTDDAVRAAIATAIDREQIANEFYGFGQPAATNILNGNPSIESPNTTREFDTEKAAQILEDAGWTLGDGEVRSKDGVELRMVYATSVNAVRQKTQAVVKSNLEAIGMAVQLEQVDAGIYFDGSPGTEQNINHFYWDVCMYQDVPSTTRPIDFMEVWYAGPDNVNIAQAANDWNGQNIQRWINPDYDALFEQAQTEPDADTLADLFIQMNDMLINEHVIVPLVVVGSARGASKRLRQENLALAAFSYDYWNIANWNLAEGQ